MNLFALSGIVCGLFCTILAFIALFFGKTKIHRYLVYFNVSVAVWGYGCFIAGIATTESGALLGWRFGQAGGTFIAVFFYHIICIFCELRRKAALIIAYAWGLFFLTFCFISDLLFARTRFVYDVHYNSATPLYTLLVFSWLFLVCLSFFEVLRYFPKTKGKKRTQTLYLIIGFLTGFVGGASTLIPMFGLNFPPFGNFTIPVYCLISTYAILRYRLMDIHLVLKKSMVYSLAASILTSLFVVLVLTMTKAISNVAGTSSFTITTIAALTVAFLFSPLKSRVQTFIDRSFYKKAYDYYGTIRNISRKLTSIFDLEEIFIYTGDILLSSLGLSSVYLLYTDTDIDYHTVYHRSLIKEKEMLKKGISVGDKERKMVNNTSELIKIIQNSDDVLVREELPRFERALGEDAVDRIHGELNIFHGEAVVPVFIDKKLTLLMILGEKMSGDMFTNEDVNLLTIISNQLSIAIKNALLYKNKIHTERLASIGMMSATFAHEIRNPLTSLKTFAQLMPEKYNDEEFRESFSRIVVGEIERIDGLINDLLDYSANKKSARVNNFNLVALIDETANYVMNKLQMEKKEISLKKKYGEDEIYMYGDVEKLKQTFINIILNGCQAMNGEGVLTIEIHRNSSGASVLIKDTGAGIHPDDMSKIFDPFVTTKDMGVGLGLAISKRIIEDHNGRIDVESEVSKGTTFSVTLPVQND